MKMRALGLICGLAISTPLLSVAAAPPDRVVEREEFVNMDLTVIEGAVRRPSGTWMDVRQKAQFRRLLALKKSFMDALQESSAEVLGR